MKYSILLSFILFSCTNSNVGNFRIGVQPNEASKNLAQFEKELEKRLGTSVTLNVAKDYAEAVNMLQKNEVDMAVLSPLNFVEAEKELELKVLFKKIYGDSEFYFSSLITKNDSKIRTLKDLKGKTIAFVDKNSASGYLYPQVMLREAGLNSADYVVSFKGTHVDAVKALISGEAEAAAVWANPSDVGGGAWTGEEFAGKDLKIRVVSLSDPIPNDPLVIKQSFYNQNPRFILKLMDALINMSENQHSAIKTVFGVDRLATATSGHYEAVRKIQTLMKEP